MQSMCPSFAFGTNGTRGSVSFGPNQGMVRKPNIAITRGKITRWCTQFEYPSFAFGTDGAHGPCILASPLGLMMHAVVSFGPNQVIVRKPNITITRDKL